MVFGSTLTLPTLLSFFLYFFSGLRVTFRDSVRVTLAYGYVSVRIG